MICENCGCEHDGSYGSGRFCSIHCRASYASKNVKHRISNFPRKSHRNELRAPYGTWKCKSCDFIGNTRAELEHHNKIAMHTEYKCQYCREVFNTIYACRTHEKYCFNNPQGLENRLNLSKSNKGKSHKVSKETKERLSEARSKVLDICSAGFKDVGWYKVVNIEGVEYTVRGHWEECVANKLTSNNILWIKNKTLKYKLDDNIIRTYNPDFYLPLTDEYIEVKGYYSDKDKIKMKAVLEQNDITLYFIDQYHYKDFVNGKILLKDLQMIL